MSLTTKPSAARRSSTRERRAAGRRELLKALPWLTPTVLLIVGIVFFPAGLMIYNSTRRITLSGIDVESVGVANYQRLFIGLNDTWLAMILVNAAFNLSFGTWIMHSFFASIPIEVEEAAQLDGAGPLQVLWRVNLPLVWPGIVTATIFTFVACWNEFAASLVIMTTAGNRPLSVALTSFVGQYETSWHYVFGVSIVGIVPVILLIMLIERRLIGGLTAGAVK